MQKAINGKVRKSLSCRGRAQYWSALSVFTSLLHSSFQGFEVLKLLAKYRCSKWNKQVRTYDTIIFDEIKFFVIFILSQESTVIV